MLVCWNQTVGMRDTERVGVQWWQVAVLEGWDARTLGFRVND